MRKRTCHIYNMEVDTSKGVLIQSREGTFIQLRHYGMISVIVDRIEEAY